MSNANTSPDPAEGPTSPKVPFADAWRFIVKVGLAAHRYGSTASRLEIFLVGLSKKFGYQGVIRSTPSEIVFALRESLDLPQRVEVIATPAPSVDLDKLARLGDLLNELDAGTMSLADSSARLDAIDTVPPPWGRFASMLGYAFTGWGWHRFWVVDGPTRCMPRYSASLSTAWSCFRHVSERSRQTGCRSRRRLSSAFWPLS